MSTLHAVDVAGRRRSPATMPGYHAGRPPANKGMHYPADPPTIEEIVAVMRQAGDGVHDITGSTPTPAHASWRSLTTTASPSPTSPPARSCPST